MKKHHFNLVEVLLAVSVVIIGFVGLMAPVSHSWSNMRQSKEKFYSELAANNLLTWMRLNITRGFTPVNAGEHPETAKFVNHVVVRPLDFSDGDFTEILYPDPIYSGVSFPTTFKAKRDMSNKVKIASYRTYESYPYVHVEFITNIEGQEVTEFSAVATLNVGRASTNFSNTANYIGFYNGDVTATVNLAWPADAPAEERSSFTLASLLF